MSIKNIHSVYFIGIGGIGMSALARYFYAQGVHVAGYDKVKTELTLALEKEGLEINYTDSIEAIPDNFLMPSAHTLIVFTPAIPAGHHQFNYFKNAGFELIKRAKLLGEISASLKTIAVAGTHGKTTVTTMIAHLLSNSAVRCNAFLGGISKNFKSNLVLADSDLIVVEADEYDRSFLNLYPYTGVITAMDADHLDIYETHQAVRDSFNAFARQFSSGGSILVKNGLTIEKTDALEQVTYSLEDQDSDYFASFISTPGKNSVFDLKTPLKTIEKLELGVPGKLNIENAVAASAICLRMGVTEDELRSGLRSFEGIQRRFDYQYDGPIVYIDDYAHHPEELHAFISSVKGIYPGKKICGIFQPHLYSRTRDFAPEFAARLSALDELILLPIYPAREEPIPGVESEIILKDVTISEKHILTKNEVVAYLKQTKKDIVLTMGAGDIDSLRAPIRNMLKEKFEL